jgi:ABC-2 type transport system permease protein
MRNPFHTPFFTVFQNEVRLNSKRVAPYALMILFTANAVLWWHQPGVKFGWATNSDWYIVRGLLAFSFLLGMPIFNAVMMGDSVIRDFRLGVDPLIFSKPVNRAQYLLGKFFGNFFVLVCCQAVFPVTQMVLQAFPTSKMIVLPVRVFPYFKHFFFFLVVTHLALATFYFTVGTLTRNSKIVYGLAVCFYPIIIAYGLFVLRPLPLRWRLMLDPLLLGASLPGNGFLHSAEFLNQYVVPYTADMIANRAFMLLAAGVCLLILYARFTISERTGNVEKLSVLSLSTSAERVSFDFDSFQETRGPLEKADFTARGVFRPIPRPEVVQVNEGIKFNLKKFVAALGIEFRLLLSERSFLVILPLVLFLSTLEVMFWPVIADPSYSAAYAANTAKSVLLFLIGITIFYLGEAMHRDSDLRVEALLWSQPIPNYVLLSVKFLSTLLLICGLILSIGVIAIVLQVLKGNAPLELLAYVKVYSLILIPNAIFLAAASLALHVLLRNRYLAYAIAVGICTGLFYLYSQGQNHWLYNPLLYQLWSYPNLGARPILQERAYVLAIAIVFIALAHLAYRRAAGRSRAAQQG